MKIFIKQIIEQDILKDVQCDCCHNSCLDDEGMNYEYATLQADWGYASWMDGEKWLCHLCNKCSIKIRDFIKELGGEIEITYG